MSGFGTRTSRSAAFVSALLLTTMLAAPAFAQIEEVVVTAQRTSQNVQSVPIAISAFTAHDLAAHQITRFNDLQFATPSVSYTKGNFTSSDFQIRGIGVTAVGYDAESGVAINFNNVYLAAPNLADGSFYDLQRIEVLRGPQSTLYGRGATGGVVNVVAAKPDLNGFSSNLQATYGNYDLMQFKGFVNVPLVKDHLGLRIAGDYVRHSGYTTNLYDNSHPDNRNEYSIRAELRWEPTSRTRVDFTGQFSSESDNHMRSQKQLCTTDPSGILGCLPGSLSINQPVNGNATLGYIASSVQGMQSTFGATLGPLAPLLGLTNLAATPTMPAGLSIPSNPRQIYTTFNPTYRAQDNFLALSWHQSWASWLDSTAVVGYDQNSVFSQESYNNVPGVNINPVAWATAKAVFLGTLNAVAGPTYAGFFAPYFSQPGQLPVSGTTNLGIVGGNYTFSNSLAAFDQSNGAATQWSGEWRFNTHFSGPLNGMLGFYYLQQNLNGNYFVNADTLDYPAIVLGGLAGLGAPALCATSGCIYGPGYYNNYGKLNRLRSKGIYAEAYYTAIPHLLKFTLGARWTEDQKYQQGRIELLSGLVPIGTTNEDAAMAALAAQGQIDFNCANGSVPGTPASASCGVNQPAGPNDAWQFNQVTYDKWTGRAVVDYTPKLSFTDQTLFYASYARGYKAGGFNPGIQPGLGVPASYNPESIDAFEVGTKNTALGGDLQANGDIWYYNYTGLQVSKIVNNTSVNENINAKLWGVESTVLWAPTNRWQFNLGFSSTNTSIGNSASIDPRNPSNGYNQALLVKDATISGTAGENCVLYYNGAKPGTLPNIGSLFFAPPGGIGALASSGIPYAAYGSCMNPNVLIAPGVTYGQALAAQGFSTTDPAVNGTYGGVPVSLKGNELQNTPPITISVGAQYTLPLPNDYHLVSRVDYYWQTDMYGSVFNGAVNKIASWDVMNLQSQLNSPNGTWYLRIWAKNVLDNNYLTGEYLTSPTSGLYTNGFYGDPRTFGLTFGVNF